MTEKARIIIGTALSIAAAAAVAVCAFPRGRKAEPGQYMGRGRDTAALPVLLHLSTEDIFNTGDSEKLQELPGIGETLASLIITERENGKFLFPEDIVSVKGIGAKKLEQLRAWMTIEPESGE
jgi:competence protein ComEA